LLGARDSTALQASELAVQGDGVAAETELDNIIGARRMQSESQSGLSCILLLCLIACCTHSLCLN